ncbi:MAG: HAD hydrolase family protein [Oscillospiraceae bacterium]|nr:HAD hydrolase family protein [Oscillospiraceae bacterium]
MKAIIVDLDRTLLHTDKTLSAYTINVLKKCHNKGLAVIAATARTEKRISAYNEQVGFDAVITMNGARIILADKVIENSISRLSGEIVLSALISIPDTLISIETSGGVYSNFAIPEWESICYDDFPNLPANVTLYKILASSSNDILYSKIKHILTEDVYYTVANNTLV